MEILNLVIIPVPTTMSSFFLLLSPPFYFPIRLAGLASLSSPSSNGVSKWLSAAAMTVDGGLAVGLLLYFMACPVKNQEGVRIQGVSVCTFSNRLYGKLLEHVA